MVTSQKFSLGEQELKNIPLFQIIFSSEVRIWMLSFQPLGTDALTGDWFFNEFHQQVQEQRGRPAL